MILHIPRTSLKGLRAAARRGGVCSSSAFSTAATRQDAITSVSNPLIKHLCKLRSSSAYCRQRGTTLVVGETLLRELGTVEDFLGGVQTVVYQDPAATPAGLPPSAQRVLVTESVFKKVSGLATVSGVAVAAEVRCRDSSPSILDSAFPPGSLTRLLVLDGVSDPGNTGTLLRTALALGWQGVWLLPGCCNPYNDKAMRASKGAAFKLPVVSGEWEELEECVGRHSLACISADLQQAEAPPSDELSKLTETGACALVLGNEGQGPSAASRARCQAVTIPMSSMESLNVGVAGGILMFYFGVAFPRFSEALRQPAQDS